MTMVMTMDRTIRISKSKLKAHMLEVFRRLEETGAEAVVTDHGRPVLRIVPIRQQRTVDEVFAPYRGGLILHEDPDTPTASEWGDL